SEPRPLHQNGLFKLIEIDHFCRPVIAVDETSNVISRTIKDFHRNDIIHDSESSSIPVLKQVEPIIAPDGWKIQTYLRFPSRDYWLRAHAVHVDDISDIMRYRAPQWDAFAEKSTLRNLITDCPTFGIPGDSSVVYLISKLKPEDDKIWIVACLVTCSMDFSTSIYQVSEKSENEYGVLPVWKHGDGGSSEESFSCEEDDADSRVGDTNLTSGLWSIYQDYASIIYPR
ncbi:hypothetical protein ZWY2020_011361, partial [Hordeum vulgare]